MSTAQASMPQGSAAPQDTVCLHCRVPVSPISTWGWKTLCVAAWPLALFSPMLVFGAFGLFAVVLLPFGVFLAGAILSRIHERAFGPPLCPRCGRIVLTREEAGEGWQTRAASAAVPVRPVTQRPIVVNERAPQAAPALAR